MTDASDKCNIDLCTAYGTQNNAKEIKNDVQCIAMVLNRLQTITSSVHMHNLNMLEHEKV